MKLVTPKQMMMLDKTAIDIIGIPGIVLMENAALTITEKALEMIGNDKKKRIVILAGKGNNGGDALGVARHLANRGYNVYTAVLAKRGSYSGDALINLNILKNMGYFTQYIENYEQAEQLEEEVLKADLVIDGIFGTGLNGEVTGFIKWIIQMTNNLAKKILSIDIPSGINGLNGEICGTCIRATETVTFCFPKVGLVVNPGCQYVGRLTVADISIPYSLKDGLETNIELLEDKLAKKGIPKRSFDSHKGDYGKMLIATGSKTMTGAGILAARAAYRAGAGLVYLAVPESLRTVYQTGAAEAIVMGTSEKEGLMMGSSLDFFFDEKIKLNSILVGPGLSVNEGVKELAHKIIKMSYCPVVLDADALNVVSDNPDILAFAKNDIIITPHPGEMARLTGKSISEVQRNRINIARQFAEKFRIVVVLKGSRTVVALPNGFVYINPTGNSSLATAGSGDVLAGIITSFLAQGVDPWKAVPAAVYIHGLAGEVSSEAKGCHGTIASDLVEVVPKVIYKLLKSKR